jgi:lipopolysaccharide biosynthesis regulator YciM
MDEAGTDKKLMEQYLVRSIALDPDSAPAAIELGNFALGRGETQQALHWYELAQKDAADEPDILGDVERQIQLVRTAPAGTVSALRNPAKE